MSTEISLSADGEYIILTVSGVITRETAMQQNLEAHALGRKYNIKKYLVDLTQARNIETTTDNYKFAYEDMQQSPGIDKTAKVVLLVDPDDHSHDFIETVSINAGLNVKIFRNKEEALCYLHGD